MNSVLDHRYRAFMVAGVIALTALPFVALYEPDVTIELPAILFFTAYLSLAFLRLRRLTPTYLKQRADVADAPAFVILGVTVLAIVAAIGARIAQNGGAAIIVDYGDWQSLGDTFQALKDHRFADPLTAPGEADLTAHVDFAALAAAAAPARASRMMTQGTLLDRLGIAARSARLAQSLTDASLMAHLAATRRLTDPAEMGSLFKAMALYRDTPPAGFDP